MKKFCISFFLILIIVLLICVDKKPETEYLRIHIRANSNSDTDQNIKLLVKDEVVEFLTPYIVECKNKKQAIDVVESLESQIDEVICNFLKSKGFEYTSKTDLRQEEFPTRVYDGVTLEGGVYDAIIVELGEAKGDNWWCVVYPPLCFTGTDIEYRSKIYDIISDFYNN